MNADIVSGNYNYLELKSSLIQPFVESVNYLMKQFCIGGEEPVIFSWQAFAQYNLAVEAVESGQYELGKELIENVLKTKKGKIRRNFDLVPYSKEFLEADYDLVQEMLRKDDKGVVAGELTSEALFMLEKEKANKALDIIAAKLPSSERELKTFIQEIALCAKSEGYHIRSASSYYTYGLVLILADEKNTVSYYVEHIVHELAHHLLFAYNGADELVLNPSEERFPAPLRDDYRPMFGLFHALFVLVKSYVALDQCKDVLSYNHGENVDDRLKELSDLILNTHETVCDDGIFTKTGEHILSLITKQIMTLGLRH